MSKRLDVPLAIAALVIAAFPLAEVIGPDDDATPSATIPAGGRILIGMGDPGEADIDLSPITYNYDHQIPVDFVFLPAGGQKAETRLSSALSAFMPFLTGNRTLGGLVDWLEAGSPASEDVALSGAVAARGARLMLTASYATPDPV